MKIEEKLELANKIAPGTKLSTSQVVDIIDEIIHIQNAGVFLEFKIDEECIKKVICDKAITGMI